MTLKQKIMLKSAYFLPVFALVFAVASLLFIVYINSQTIRQQNESIRQTIEVAEANERRNLCDETNSKYPELAQAMQTSSYCARHR